MLVLLVALWLKRGLSRGLRRLAGHDPRFGRGRAGAGGPYTTWSTDTSPSAWNDGSSWGGGDWGSGSSCDSGSSSSDSGGSSCSSD